jgi:ribonuclease HI
MSEDVVEIYADGACRGNPGPGGWGVLLRAKGRERELLGSEPATTNNRMELMAVISALQVLRRRCAVRVYTDSQYVQKGISARQPVKNADLWQRLDALAQGHDIEWHWVRGHAGHAENERADALANRAIDQMQQAAG